MPAKKAAPKGGKKQPITMPGVIFPNGDEDMSDRKGGGEAAPKAPKKAGKRR